MVKNLKVPKLRYAVTGIKKNDFGQSLEERQEYANRRNKIFGGFLEHMPALETFRRRSKRYSVCRGPDECGLHHICEHCWFDRISMPVVRSLCGGPDNYRPTRPTDNLYVVTFSNVRNIPVREPGDAFARVKEGRWMFHHLTSRPVFKKGGIISGGMTYWYPWRIPFHSMLDEKLSRHRWVSSGRYEDGPGWGFKVVMLVRTTFRIPSGELRRYILKAMNWVRTFTPEDRKAAHKDLKLQLTINAQDGGVFTPFEDPRQGRYLVQVRRCRTNAEAVVRYSTCGYMYSEPNTKVTRTSFDTKIVRNLRLPLLECDPREGAWMLGFLGLPEKDESQVKHVIQFGDFLKEKRPQTTWMKFSGPVRHHDFLYGLLRHCGFDRAPVTEAENNQFRRALNRMTKEERGGAIYGFLRHATCSEFSGE